MLKVFSAHRFFSYVGPTTLLVPSKPYFCWHADHSKSSVLQTQHFSHFLVIHHVTAPPTFSHSLQLDPIPFICAKIEKIQTWKLCMCCILQWCLNYCIVKLSKDLLSVLGISLSVFLKVPKENSVFSTFVRDLFLSDVNKSYTHIYFVVKFQGFFFLLKKEREQQEFCFLKENYVDQNAYFWHLFFVVFLLFCCKIANKVDSEISTRLQFWYEEIK